MPPELSAPELAERVVAAKTPAIARAISWAERGYERFPELLRLLYPRTGRARVVGLTGAPGAGKSTLTAALARLAREEGKRVGIVAVDPSSPFTGGAILGDRIRMQDLYTDPGVLIRSMATRGQLGGLSRATADAVDVLDAAGFDEILVDYVKKCGLPYIDTLVKVGQEFKNYDLTINQFCERLYVSRAGAQVFGHYTPSGNFWYANAVRQGMVDWLNPKPPAYQ